MNVTIVGLGLMGGSAAIDLKKRGFAEQIIGVDKNKVNAHIAQHIGLVDAVSDLETAIKVSDIVILAIPVSSALEVLPRVLDVIKHQTVLDFCSTKKDLLKSIKHHKNRKQYVASHPMAGTEFSGPWAAKTGLFDGKASILCNTEESDMKSVEHIKKVYDALHMRTIEMDAESHDIHAAYVSHISHISSFALALTVLEKEKNEKHIFDLASGGFDSTVRLAKSSAEMWTPIFMHNQENVLEVIDTYMEKMQSFRDSIAEGNDTAINNMIQESNRIKRIVK